MVVCGIYLFHYHPFGRYSCFTIIRLGDIPVSLSSIWMGIIQGVTDIRWHYIGRLKKKNAKKLVGEGLVFTWVG